MKENINFVSALTPQPIKGEPKNFTKEVRLLTIANLGLGGLEVTLIIILIALSIAVRYKNLEEIRLENKTIGLSSDQKIVSLLIKRQNELNSINDRKIDFKKTINLIQTIVPEDTILTSLKVDGTGATLSAKTKTVSSFSQFVNGLLLSRNFRQVSLTGSSYDQKTDLFYFTLECQTK